MAVATKATNLKFEFNGNGAVIDYDYNLKGEVVNVNPELSEVMAAMREWVCDCAVDAEDEEARLEASDKAIYNYVRRNYDGGVAEFLRTIAA